MDGDVVTYQIWNSGHDKLMKPLKLESESNYKHNEFVTTTKVESLQQPEKGGTYCDSSRSWRGGLNFPDGNNGSPSLEPRSWEEDSISSDVDNGRLSPQERSCGPPITSIETVPDLPTTRSAIAVAYRKSNERDIAEFLFADVEDMAEVVGVGLEWAKVVVTKELDVEVREIGEHSWRDLWAGQGCEELELMNIILPEPQTEVGGSSSTRLEDQTERFGVGLTKSDVIGVYAEDHLEQLHHEGFSPLVYDLAEYMGLEGENALRCRQVSGSEGGSSKGAAKAGCSTEQSGGNKDVHQDPSQGPPQDGSQDGFQDLPEPSSILPSDMQEKKVLVVSIFPLWSYLREGSGGKEIHKDHGLYKATIAPVLKFMFEVMGEHKKITTTLRSLCDLGEGGGANVNPWSLGYFQDNITISLDCKKDRAATLSSPRVENVEVVKRTITANASSSYKWGCKGEIVLPLLGLQAGGGDGETTETGSSSALEISVTQLSSFHVHPRYRAGSLVYNFVYPEEVEARIADAKQGPRQLITSGIGGTFEPTIVGEWDGLDESRKCKYSFKTQRDITSIEGLRQSRVSGQEVPECIQQQYEIPLWVNHAMTHILRKHEIRELRAPEANRLKNVIAVKPALHG